MNEEQNIEKKQNHYNQRAVETMSIWRSGGLFCAETEKVNVRVTTRD